MICGTLNKVYGSVEESQSKKVKVKVSPIYDPYVGEYLLERHLY